MDPVILVFAAIALFILFRLFSVLGTRTGHETQHDFEPIRPKQAESEAQADTSPQEDSIDTEARPSAPISTNARLLRDADPAFDEIEFLGGARSAYEMIVEAFSAGDLKSIRNYLSDSVYETFKTAVSGRENAGHTADLKFVGIERAALVDSNVEGDRLIATTEFTSNQVRVTRDADGNVVEGDPNRIDLVKDRWTFSRKFPANDPNWILVATGGAA